MPTYLAHALRLCTLAHEEVMVATVQQSADDQPKSPLQCYKTSDDMDRCHMHISIIPSRMVLRLVL